MWTSKMQEGKKCRMKMGKIESIQMIFFGIFSKEDSMDKQKYYGKIIRISKDCIKYSLI